MSSGHLHLVLWFAPSKIANLTFQKLSVPALLRPLVRMEWQQLPGEQLCCGEREIILAVYLQCCDVPASSLGGPESSCECIGCAVGYVDSRVRGGECHSDCRHITTGYFAALVSACYYDRQCCGAPAFSGKWGPIMNTSTPKY